MNNVKIIPGLLLATRTDATGSHLPAFILHHLAVCERAVVLCDRRSTESPERILEKLAAFGTRVTFVDHPSVRFHNGDTRNALANATVGTGCDVVLHLDQDEFVLRLDLISEIVGRIRAGQSDFAEGRMVCRFAPGGKTYPAKLATFEEYQLAAPVRTHLLRPYGFPDVKCYLTRVPHIEFHKAQPGWRRDRQGMPLEHFRWTRDCVQRSEVKYQQHPPYLKQMIRNRDHDVRTRNTRFLSRLKRGFRPYANGLEGWFDYADVYRTIAEEAPNGTTIVELGVWQGKSISYLGEYANLLGKTLRIVGYDQFDPTYYLCGGRKQPVPGVWENYVQATLRHTVWVNTPEIVKCDSAKAASRHADKSVFAVWVDAGHSEARVTADIRAWLPKIQPGGILAGHDLDHPKHPGVRRALTRLGVTFSPTSKSSWIYRVP